MAGAPRTTRVRMASATSGHDVYARSTSSVGSFVWSSSTSPPSSQRTGVITCVLPLPSGERAG